MSDEQYEVAVTRKTPEEEKIFKLEKRIKDLESDHKMMSNILTQYKETPMPDAFGDPYFFANQALERRKIKL